MLTSLAPLLAVVIVAGPQPRPCTLQEAKAAEEGTYLARRAWADLHAQYVTYVKRAACDDGAIAEGWSDAVGHLLANSWERLPDLARLTESEPAFLGFVIRHIDLTIPADTWDRIRANANTRCPEGYGNVCKAVLLALAKGDAEATLDKSAPGVVWRSVIELDLDGDGRMDFALLGRTQSEAVVGVVFGASRPSPAVRSFRRDAASQNGLCGTPDEDDISVEDLATPEDPDDGPPAAARAPAGSRRRGFRLDSGGCDAFHFFFDGRGVTWWRR